MKVKTRNYTVDILRIIAAFGVIALHVRYSTNDAKLLNIFFWPLCVPFFFLTSVMYFVAGLNPQVKLNDVFYKTYKRLIIPYFTWTTVYLLLFFIKGAMTGKFRSFVLWRVLFYGDSAVQLYFLPSLILMQFFALSIYSIVYFHGKERWKGIALFSICLVYMVWREINKGSDPKIWGSFIEVVSYILLAFWLSRKRDSFKKWHGWLGIGMILFSVVSNYFGYRYIILGYPYIFIIGGSGVLLLAVGFPMVKIPRWFQILTSLSFGIYLSHVIFLEAFEFILEKMKGKVVYDFTVKTIVVTLIFIFSGILTLFLMRFNLLSKLFLGEESTKK